MTTPKQVSQFAKEYQDLYIGLGQCKSAYDIVLKERDEAVGKLNDIYDFCTTLKEALERNKPGDYRDMANVLESIINKI